MKTWLFLSVKNINIYKSSGLPDFSSRLLKDGFLYTLHIFADVTVLYYIDKSIENLYSTVQSDLEMVVNWCS